MKEVSKGRENKQDGQEEEEEQADEGVKYTRGIRQNHKSFWLRLEISSGHVHTNTLL